VDVVVSSDCGYHTGKHLMCFVESHFDKVITVLVPAKAPARNF
jgi:hypothetical protein